MLTKYSVKKPFTVLVAVIIVIIFGVVSFTRMTLDLFPKFDLPYVVVMTTYPGASSQEVESTVTEPLEAQLSSLDDLEGITSTSQENASLIYLEFEQGANLDTVSVDIRDKIELASSGWSDTIQNPIILKINPSMIPVTVAAVSQKDKDINETSALMEDGLLRKLEGISGVASVTTSGMVENTIHVNLDETKIEKVNKQISEAISSGFSNAKEQINTQIANAQAGIDQINSAKEQIKDAQNTIVEQSDTMKQLFVTLKTLNTTKEGLQYANQAIKNQIMQSMPNASEEEIEKACMENSVYAQNKKAIEQAESGINNIITQMKPMESELNAAGINLSQLTSLSGVISAEQSFNKTIANSENQLNNSMAELTGNSALLSAANLQLQSSLSQIAQQESSAQSSADVSSYLTVSGISTLIAAQDFEMPAGYISDDSKDLLVTVGESITSIDQLKNMVILDIGIDGVDPITLEDVANISYVTSGEDNYSKINGSDGILLIFSKQSDYSTTEVADNIQDEFKVLSEEYDGLSFDTLSDQGQYIHLAVNSVLENLIVGAVLAILILLFFLRDIKPTMITAISIPISITFAIVLMYFSGITLNIVSLAGLAVGVGMLVDNSIVVIENIYRLRALGYSKIQAAISGAVQVAGAITASTLTTICVFAPLIFVDGMTKIIFKDMALTVTYSLLASLIVALTVVPTMGSVTLDKIKVNTLLNRDSRSIRKYRKTLEFVLHHKAVTLIIVFVLLVTSVVVTVSKGFEYMPSMSSTQISATIEMPEDATEEDTIRIGDEISEAVSQIGGVETVGSMLASNMSAVFGVSSGSADFSSISMYVILDEDKMSQTELVNETIIQLAEENNCKADVSNSTDMTSMLGGSGISINIESDNLDSIRTAALSIEELLRDTEGLTDVSDVNDDSTEELRVIVDREKAMKYGLTVAQVYAQIAEKISSEHTAITMNYDGSDKDVIVSSKGENNLTEAELMDLSIAGSGTSTETVKLSQIATAEKDSTFSTINRIDQKRGQNVSAQVEDGYNVTKMTEKIQKDIDGLDLPSDVTVIYDGENEQIMDAMIQLLKMFLLGFLLVYLVMVAQFQSLLSPFIVMFTVPLAVTGAMLALLISGFELSVISMIGIIVLMGIIVNNAIVLIDYINQMRLDGMDRHEAIIEAGSVRMRPVLMTAATTVLGLLPLAFGIGQGAEMMQPVAVVCIGGLVYATLMTLFIIPVMYDILARKNIKKFSREELTIVDA